MRSAPTSTACPGRSSNTATASVTANSGATPNATEALDEPASRIPKVMKRFEMPGAIAPATRNGSRPSSVTPPWIAAATQRTPNVATCMKSAPTAADTSGGTSAKRTATGIAPNSAAETSARRTASIYGAPRAGTSRRSAAAAAGSASTIPASITAQPAQPAQPSRSDRSTTPKSAANGASRVNTSAARAAVVRDCTHVATR